MRTINLRYVDEEYDEDGILTRYSLHYPDDFNFGYDIVDDIGTNDPGRPAMIWCNDKGDERRFTFGDIMRLSNKTANYLTSLGIGKGDFVMVVLKHNWQFWYVSVALCKIGAVMVPASFMLTKHDVVYRVNSAEIKGIVATSQSGVPEVFEGSFDECPTLTVRLMANGPRAGWDDLDAGIDAASETFGRVPTKAADPMLMYFSSGTSGYPKMVLHDHLYALGHLLTAKHWHAVQPDGGIHFTIADTGWGKAVWGKLYGQWIMEACVFVYEYEKFVPGNVMALIGKYGITTLCCPPTMFRMFLLNQPERYDLSSLKHCSIAGEALNPDVFNNWYKATGLKLMEGFGQTETTVVICNTRGMEPKPGSMGKPSPQYEVKIVDANGVECLPGMRGEIIIRYEPKVPGLLMEYYRNPEKTADTLRDGYHHTGDTAWYDEDGYIWYVGRNDDIIKSSGYRIGPFEIESVLVEHPAVKECAVTGVPDAVRGQLVKATIVLSDGYTGDEALVKELQDYVKKETAPYKYPRVVEFVDELPKTINGKIKRTDIRKKDWDGQ
jgi:acetyl-CoA synthetase